MTIGKDKLRRHGFRQRIELSIEVGADSWGELLRALATIGRALYDSRTGYISIASGGCGSGFTIEGDVDQEWDGAKYSKAIQEWRERYRAPKLDDDTPKGSS